MSSKVVRKVINVTKPLGPFSQAILVDHTLYVAGQVGLIPETLELVTGGAAAEADQVLKNIRTVLEAAGSSLGNVVKATVLLKDINDFTAVNEVYAKYFPKKQPARAAFQVVALPKGASVEIEAVAIVGDIIDA